MFLIAMLIIIGIFGTIVATFGLIWGTHKWCNWITLIMSSIIISSAVSFLYFYG